MQSKQIVKYYVLLKWIDDIIHIEWLTDIINFNQKNYHMINLEEHEDQI